ncbi:hypothetical protein BEI46_18450 [Aliivibrio fischeri]|uniref:trypsin-like peptidase domain-containing protein n=1 Tax=Aliivibrio fischeri TaxID=668 RepID=UPI00084C6149|nr:trypsin-like peptidase domain-containing protein [Aliivibrio fischeri]OED52248.1 hypothetical protein BEI46_18450 [Aliivibrio fischeri]
MIIDISELDGTNVEYIDSIVEKYKEVVVPFYTNNQDKGYDFNSFGSGFIVKYNQSFFIVTALHVLSDARTFGASVIVIGPHKMIVENINVNFNKKHDVAVFCIDQWMESNNITELPYITLNNDISFQSINKSFFLLMGYPATKNKVRDCKKGLNPHLYSITAEKFVEKPPVKTEVESAIYYEFASKKLIDSYNKKFGRPPDLYGMSGGPAFEIVVRPSLLMNNNTHVEFSLHLQGVLVEWHKSHKCVLSSTKDVIDVLIEMSYEQLKS